MSTKPALSPFVYWGQNKECITLNVTLQDVEDPVIKITEENLSFQANGEGLHGFKEYQFSIDFYQFIDDKKSKYRVTSKSVEFQLVKQTREVWPRLTYSNQKPQWLKVNFDQFAFDDEDSSSSDDPERDKKMREEFIKRQAEALEQREWNSMRQFYLFTYNLFMFIGYSYIFAAMAWQYFQYGEAAKSMTFESFGTQMMMLQALAVLEVLHPLFGAVKTGVMPPFLQFLGRFFVLFIVLLPNFDLHSKTPVWGLFGAWSLAEVVRYPFYMLSSYNKEFGLITYIRYTAWIVLYPLGIVCEGFIMLESLHFFDRTGYWSLELPNKYNMSFSFSSFLRLYMLAFLPSSLILINHMYTQRKKKISPNIWKREQMKKKLKFGSGPMTFTQKVEKKD